MVNLRSSQQAFFPAQCLLSLSGSPFREEEAPSPLVRGEYANFWADFMGHYLSDHILGMEEAFFRLLLLALSSRLLLRLGENVFFGA